MAAGPNQTGSILQSPVSSAMGYSSSLTEQLSEEERRKKALQMAGGTPAVTPSSILRNMFGY